MTSREQFEKWFNKRSNWKITSSMRKKDGYVGNPSAQSKWEVWQASRSSIELNLTSEWDISSDGSRHYDADSVDEQLLALGIEVNK